MSRSSNLLFRSSETASGRHGRRKKAHETPMNTITAMVTDIAVKKVLFKAHLDQSCRWHDLYAGPSEFLRPAHSTASGRLERLASTAASERSLETLVSPLPFHHEIKRSTHRDCPSKTTSPCQLQEYPMHDSHV